MISNYQSLIFNPQLKNKLNNLGQAKIPFLFIIDFDCKKFYVAPLTKLASNVLFTIDGFSNLSNKYPFQKPHSSFQKKAISLEEYKVAFNRIKQEMFEGNTYLLNLTFPTLIKTEASLLNIFLSSQAPFKLFFQDKFITFSPERFIKIENNSIKTYPMKGTINALIPNAQAKILASEKEKAEHTMVVDLLRNDLAMVAKNVRVNRFRYIDKIVTGSEELLQVSSEISGVLAKDWPQRIGDILFLLLPAGSISGTPKKKTLEIIKAVENYQRGFFTGIFGYFDGNKLDSAVMIRFIEKDPKNQLIYKSGGGITIDSNVTNEYREMLEKVYIPIFFNSE